MLHLLCASDDPLATEFLQLLLTHPSVNVNLQDEESGWTALHRALYAGHIHIALILLERTDIDYYIKDWEGLTAFDLYNTTVEGTCPSDMDEGSGADLFVWGGNRNYTLGLSHGNDSALPERVKLKCNERRTPLIAGARFNRPHVRDISMSRWHTVLATTEPRKNVYVCGIGSQARLGRSAQSLPTFEPLRDFSDTANIVVAGSDHTIIVTETGAVYTFGSNRMAQLGYAIEEGLGVVSSSSGTKRSGATSHPNQHSLQGPVSDVSGVELDLQVTPRRVQGPLKREVIIGAAASRLHSVAYTASALYTWGTNNGQLGYDRHSAPVQVQPRRVTVVSVPVRQVAATEFATACLLETWDVMLLHGDANYRVMFPSPRVTSDVGMFRPRQMQPKPCIRKLTCSGTTFAALSDLGDLFTFHVEHSSTTGAKVVPPRPHLVWSVRRKFSAVRDVAIGNDNALILCTADGHVYVRAQKLELKVKSRTPKFQLVPYLQRIVQVRANVTGSFAAMQVPWRLPTIPIRGRSLEQDLVSLVSPIQGMLIAGPVACETLHTDNGDENEEDLSNSHVPRYVSQAKALLSHINEARSKFVSRNNASHHDAVLLVEHGAYAIPVHRLMLALRIPNLASVLWLGGEAYGVKVRDAHTVDCGKLSFASAMFLLLYLYTDDMPPVWCASVGYLVAEQARQADFDVRLVYSELYEWATSLSMTALQEFLASRLVKPPRQTLHPQLHELFEGLLAQKPLPGADVVLHLADADITCHSIFLRRSPMLESLLDWRAMRGDSGYVHIDIPHWTWPIMRVGLAFLYMDADTAAFQGTDEDKSPDQFIDFVLDVLQLADELLLEKLQHITYGFLSPRVKPTNVAALLSDALRLNAPAFSQVCMEYATRHLETLLEMGCLSSLDVRERHILAEYIQAQQDRVLHRSLARDRMLALSIKHQDYIAELDLPKPSLNLACLKVPKRMKSPRIAPVDDMPAPSTPSLQLQGDESLLFTMDDVAPEPLPEPAWQTVGVKPPRQPRRSSDAPLASSPPMSAPRSSQKEQRPMGLSPPSTTSPITPGAQTSVIQMSLATKVTQKERKKQQQQQQQRALSSESRPAWKPTSSKSRKSDVWGTSPSSLPGPSLPGTPPAQSFAEIQAQQQAAMVQQRAQQIKPKSFAQILHEERVAQQQADRDRQEAEAFERWFEEESRRVQEQEARLAQRGDQSRRGRPRRGRRRGKANPAMARIDDD